MAKVEVENNYLKLIEKEKKTFILYSGCAFVTFQKRQCALNAIKSMHQSQTMEVRDFISIDYE